MEILQTVMTNISRVCADITYQPRMNGLETEHVRALQECPDAWPPLSVVEVNGQLVLVDGFHRLAAAQNLGLTEVHVQVIHMPDDGDLYALAFTLNASHGRPLSLNDRRSYADKLLRHHPEWSDREIGRRTGLSSNTVGKIRGQLEASAQIEQHHTRVGAGGYTYSVDPTIPARPDHPEQDEPSDVQDWSADDRRGQRETVEYLRRLAAFLVESDRLTGWESPDDAAFACQAILGDTRATELAELLGGYSLSVIEVAMALGWDLDGDQK